MSKPEDVHTAADHPHHDDHDLDSQTLEEEIALLEGTTDQLRSKSINHVDGDATYQHETWGFIG